MIYREVRGNLFNLADSHVLVHCISHDCRMGAGIAKEFTRRYPWLKPKVKEDLEGLEFKPRCIHVVRYGTHVMNLITKKHSYGKPTIETLRDSLVALKDYCEYLNIKRIAMPTIGCGLDRLNWGIVSEMVKDIFKDTDIEIEVRYL